MFTNKSKNRNAKFKKIQPVILNNIKDTKLINHHPLTVTIKFLSKLSKYRIF